jgi:pyrimidine deaminase RibD-like protein
VCAEVSASDDDHMSAALALAREGLGRVWPNPSVGCVVVQVGRVVGLGRTADGGRPHAEMVALEEAGSRAAGSRVFVTLEPCSHWGKTSPCSEALAEAGVAEVLVAVRDPDPRVNGKGIAWLERAGIRVTEGPGTIEAARINAGFFCRILEGRPLVAITSQRGADLADLAQSFDAVAASAVFAAIDRPQIGFALRGIASRFEGIAAWWLTHGVGAASGPAIAVPEGRRVEESAHAALAALGELGLTRLLVHADDPVAAALAAAQLVDERI